eukprot:TRINITY_DN52254_c0_g1_i1.p1 TRINITY_DN52254_c0_g1~~TRINITY_DN52254_c0_g1_i1.p1  ORF type:complete len:330 (+),score=46.49 TRINITY_DN52254_c0_g1_i1:51-992(+)
MDAAAQQRYDRQIRLWGLDAQKRMLEAKVLIVNLGGIGVEIAKNIVLSGVGSVHIVDSHVITEEDCCSNFFVRESEVGQNRGECSVPRVQQLNPFVKVTCENLDVSAVSADWWKQFDVACLTDCSKEVQIQANDACRETGVRFISCNSFGLLGMFFSDFGDKCEYSVTTEDKTHGKITKQHTDNFVALSSVLKAGNKWNAFKPSQSYLACQVLLRASTELGDVASTNVKLLCKTRDDLSAQHGFPIDALPDSFFEANSQQCFGDFSPVCTVVGGEAAQEILKVVQLTVGATIINNTFIFDGIETYRGLIEKAK